MLKAGAIDRTGNGPNGYLAEIGLRVPLQWGMHEAQQRDRRGWFLRKAAFSRPVNRLLGGASLFPCYQAIDIAA